MKRSLPMTVLERLHVKRAQSEADDVAEFAEDSTESPIEALFLAAWIYFHLDALSRPPSIVGLTNFLVSQCIYNTPATMTEVKFPLDCRKNSYDFTCELWPQFQIDVADHKFRTDFCALITSTRTKEISLCIEIDGHDYHERTKQQASNDRRRERLIQLAGLEVIRFTGSDVWNNPPKTIDETLQRIFQLFSRQIETASAVRLPQRSE